ncbi:MAG: tyrosine--tRNA ligase [Candidatus Nomurabacteria bacterium]|jgi:tyrosyl-tRNA synthetase|nr:tyrosine--tRNA ligase [Candidatus Nomurabacteria bacterium]
MTLSEELIWRGMIDQNTFGDPTELDKKPCKFYLGVDPSADSLTIGNLAALMMAKVFLRHGAAGILLVGGATGQIGDPKFDKARDLKPADEIAHNAAAITTQLKQLFPENVKIVNNNDWLPKISFYDFMRNVGTYFSLTQLLDREFVKARTGAGGSGLNVAEFCYSLLQGYDFLHLYQNFGVDLQLCGADQMGNCISGVHLIKRAENARSDVWSTPLILDANGKKFGKSEGNAVWLDAKKTSPFQFYQFWLNTDDAGVENYLKIYTELGKDEVDDIMTQQKANPAAREAQKALAFEATKIVHGAAAAESARNVSRVLFGGANLADLKPSEIDQLAGEIPTAKAGQTASQILTKTGLAKSASEARRLIAQNSISLNGQKIATDQIVGKTALLKKGKNSFVLVR